VTNGCSGQQKTWLTAWTKTQTTNPTKFNATRSYQAATSHFSRRPADTLMPPAMSAMGRKRTVGLDPRCLLRRLQRSGAQLLVLNCGVYDCKPQF